LGRNGLVRPEIWLYMVRTFESNYKLFTDKEKFVVMQISRMRYDVQHENLQIRNHHTVV
jgi:hypothetical protein